MKVETLEPVGPPWWDDRPVYIVCGGRSAEGLDLERLRGRARVVAVNDCALALPWVDALASVDRTWIARRSVFVASFRGEAWLGIHSEVATYDRVPAGARFVPIRSAIGCWSTDPSWVCHGGNSGFFAFNLTALKRASAIRIVGLDLRGDGGHWHGGYGWSSGMNGRYFAGWAQKFATAALAAARQGIQVWNCNPDSAVTGFPLCTFDEACRADGLL